MVGGTKIGVFYGLGSIPLQECRPCGLLGLGGDGARGADCSYGSAVA